jgi:hypothetical protein
MRPPFSKWNFYSELPHFVTLGKTLGALLCGVHLWWQDLMAAPSDDDEVVADIPVYLSRALESSLCVNTLLDCHRTHVL